VIRVFLAALVFFGCAGQGERIPGMAPVFSAPAGFESEVASVASRLARATGRADIASAPGGKIVVLLVDEIPSPSVEGGFDCGQTASRRYEDTGEVVDATILIDVTPPAGCMASLEETLMHESMHALNPAADHALAPSVFSQHGGTPGIDEGALAALCSGSFECEAFQPEL
jgi:hypothetical protein